jgi:dihydrofolate reductase
MPKLSVFNSVTLDGFFTGVNGDLSWAHENTDAEWNDFVGQNASLGGCLLFGRKTYEMMVSYWPTPQAAQQMPEVAEHINKQPKVVFSRTLKEATWQNTKLVKGDLIAEVRKMKAEPGEDMVILGSGSIVAQLTRAGLIDEYQFVVVPVVLGKGRTMFEGIDDKMKLERTDSRTFKNGNVFLSYKAKE